MPDRDTVHQSTKVRSLEGKALKKSVVASAKVAQSIVERLKQDQIVMPRATSFVNTVVEYTV